jgi:hypothetical protein
MHEIEGRSCSRYGRVLGGNCVSSRRVSLLRSPLWLAALLLSIAVLFPSAAGAAGPPSATRIACVVYDTSIGQYGAYVFQPRFKPRNCVEFKGNQPAHVTESRLKSIKWRRWGSARTTATATWYYCGMGSCIFRRAFLVASAIKETCGFPAYTFLKMRLPATRIRGERFSAYQGRFRLPACRTVFSE